MIKTIYCMSCGAANKYSGPKPSNCTACKSSFSQDLKQVIASKPSSLAPAPKNIKFSEPEVLDYVDDEEIEDSDFDSFMDDDLIEPIKVKELNLAAVGYQKIKLNEMMYPNQQGQNSGDEPVVFNHQPKKRGRPRKS